VSEGKVWAASADPGLRPLARRSANWRTETSTGAVNRLGGEGSAVRGLLPSPKFLGHRHEVRSDDVLLIFTDGLVEILNAKGEEFRWNRLQVVVEQNQNRSLKSISEAILEQGIRWGTLLLIRFT
jgi:serine phosphatase RsbU (regulator of sigma subunit)